MDRNLNAKIKRKRCRVIVIAALLVAAAIAAACGFSFEKSADAGGDKSDAGKEPVGKVTIEIECSQLAEAMDALKNKSLKEYIPEDGVILPATEYDFEEGETVYDCLENTCRRENIHLESTDSTSYGSKYIEGIGHLYEKDAGPRSGWTYEVNDESPNYGCSKFALENGQKIKWIYVVDYTENGK